MCQLHFISPRKFLGTHLLEAERTSWLLNVARKNRVLENFRGPYQEQNPEISVSWHSASTKCATTHPIKQNSIWLDDIKSSIGKDVEETGHGANTYKTSGWREWREQWQSLWRTVGVTVKTQTGHCWLQVRTVISWADLFAQAHQS